jgi:nitronate monooxygenase
MTLPAILNGRLSVPAIASPLFIVSNPDLALAQCKAGVVGSFPALNARPQELLDDWLHRMREELSAYDTAHPERPSAPFAVNHLARRARGGEPGRALLRGHRPA